MNSNIVKPEKFGHLHLVYHFTIPLRSFINMFILKSVMIKDDTRVYGLSLLKIYVTDKNLY